MSADIDEADLWARALDHDAQAFRAVFVLHRDRVLRHAVRLTESKSDAEDVTAASFLELWRRRHRVRVVDGSVLPWLLLTTTNLARNQWRGLLRYRAVLRRFPHTGAETGPLPENVAESRLRDQSVRRAVLQLPRDDAALLVLTAFEGLSGPEAAALLGISAGTARNRLVRIRRTLRDELGHLVESTEERE